jgi:predicted DsbA family dithiol-disulfide isomerase
LEGTPKAPDTPDNPRAGARLKSAGAAVGIDFTGKTDRYPNTLGCHVLLTHALEKGGPKLQNELSEILFRAYFTDGTYPNTDNLVVLGKEVGLDEEETRAVLTNREAKAAAAEESAKWSRKGVRGVPYFFINGQGVFSGAQDPSTIKRAIVQAAQ